MRTRTWIIAMLAIALPLLVGCQQQRTTAERETERKMEPETAPPASAVEQEQPGMADTSPMEAQMWIDDVTVGHQVAPDGAIAASHQGDEFKPGQPIYIAMEITDAPAGAAVKVAVIDSDDETRVFENEKPVEAGGDYLNFTIEPTATWAVGDYRIEVWTGDEQVATEHIQIVEQAAAR